MLTLIRQIDNLKLGSIIENSYLSHCIIDSFPRIVKGNNMKLKLVLLDSRGRRNVITYLVLIILFSF